MSHSGASKCARHAHLLHVGNHGWPLLGCVLKRLLCLFSASLHPLHAYSNQSTNPELSLLRRRLRRRQLFGDRNLRNLPEGKTIYLSLDERTVVCFGRHPGSGFASKDLYLHGFFSASAKFPPDFAAGVVVTFYMSNGDVFEKNRVELESEFLGNIMGREWRECRQTSIGTEAQHLEWKSRDMGCGLILQRTSTIIPFCGAVTE